VTAAERRRRAGEMQMIFQDPYGSLNPRHRIGEAVWRTALLHEIAPRAEVEAHAAGSVGVVSQSGGLGTDIVRRGLNRGIKFSGLVTVGNCADIGPADMLEFYFADPQTKVIGMYIETARDAGLELKSENKTISDGLSS
jgi:ABC-type dipeptide/oligopeptide/nickel transport system ATPase component